MTILAAIQLCSTPQVESNISLIEQQLAQFRAENTNETLVAVLPECCLFFGGKDHQQLELAKQNSQNQQITNAFSQLAKKYRLTLVAGSMPLWVKGTNKFTNSCCVFDENGRQQAQYDKIHLFDVDVNTDINSNEEADSNAYQESFYTQAGDSCTVTALQAHADIKLGLTICYDLRFPELFRQLRIGGATIITVPSAFTKVTGKAHWQALLQARAIENQVYIVAAGQQGTHENGRETWGNSMIINPWGEIIANLETGNGFISAPYDQQKLMQLRAAMPVAAHNQFTSQLIRSTNKS